MLNDPQFLAQQIRKSAQAGNLTRRQVLQRAAAIGLSAPVIAGLLAACGDEDPAGTDDTAEAADTRDDEEEPVEADDDESADTDPPDDGSPAGQVIVGLSQEPTVFHPLMPSIEVDSGIHYNVFDSLWDVDENGEFYPNLATEVPTVENGGISEDGLTWTVNLRDDVTWHDGEPFTAEDVQFTWELITSDDFQAAQRQGHNLIEEFEVVDSHTVRWTMSEAYAPYQAILSRTFIVPKHILEGAQDPNTTDFNQHPVGTGPYTFVEQVTGDRIVLEAREDGYHREGPHIQTVVVQYVPDLTMLYTQFRTGEVDFTDTQGISTEHYEEAVTLEDREVHLIESASIEAIWFNYDIEMFQEKAVREALYYGMDKDTIVNEIYEGLVNHTETFLPTSWVANEDLPQHQYDPERANQILEEAGWVDEDGDGIREKNGTKLQFQNSTTAGHQIREQAQVYLQQIWREIGVDFQIDNHPPAVVWGDFWTQSEFETLMVGLNYGIGGDPDFSRVMHSEGDANYMLYSNPELDELLDEAVTELEPDERGDLYYESQRIIHEDLALLPIKQYAAIRGVNAGLHGFTPNPNVTAGIWNLNTWYWED